MIYIYISQRSIFINNYSLEIQRYVGKLKYKRIYMLGLYNIIVFIMTRNRCVHFIIKAKLFRIKYDVAYTIIERFHEIQLFDTTQYNILCICVCIYKMD